MTQSNLTCTDTTSTACNIDCKNSPQLCINSIINCDEAGSNKECYIRCDGFRRRLIASSVNINTCSGDYGCCGAIMYCPKNEYCSIDCTAGCHNVTIYAQHSTWLYVKNCNPGSNGDNYCNHMNIYCPRDGRGDNTGSIHSVTNICTVQGDSSNYDIEESNIYTEEGWNDLDLQNIGAINTKMYCGRLSTEYSCEIDSNSCVPSGDTTCNSFILPTYEPTTSPIPTASPTLNPTMNPTIIPSSNPTNDPSVDPTVDPTWNPTSIPSVNLTINPTIYPTISPITSKPSNNPTSGPTDTTIIVGSEPTQSPITYNPTQNPIKSVTVSTTESIQETEQSAQSFWESVVGYDLEIVLIVLCALLILCCICLFGCYWCRKEHIYREMEKINIKQKSRNLSKPLLSQQTANNTDSVEMDKMNYGQNNDDDVDEINGSVHIEGQKYNDEEMVDEIDDLIDSQMTTGSYQTPNINDDEFIVSNDNNVETPPGDNQQIIADDDDNDNDEMDQEDNIITDGFVE